MKRVGILFFLLSLSLLVLLGSGQFTIGKMICQENGFASYSLGNATDCCDKKEANHQTLEKSCCELITISYTLNDFSISQKTTISVQGFDFFFLPAVTAFHLSSPFFLHIPFVDFPPPDAKEILHLFCSLLL